MELEFDSGTYYLGISGHNYILSVCANTTSGKISVCDKTSDKGTFNIGIPRYGEMFATSSNMWLINPYSSSHNLSISSTGVGSHGVPTESYRIRPTVHLKSTVKIISGSGTEFDPYVVGL